METSELPADLAHAVEFHGHLCPGLTIGYLATRIGLEKLGVERAEDEELIAIVENKSCAVDAVQALAGCTFGKGNLFFRDHGKMVFTFASRISGKAVRVSVKHRTNASDESASEDPAERRDRQTRTMLKQSPEELFMIREEDLDVPRTAEIRQSVVCSRCGESVMDTRTRAVDGKVVCIPCATALGTADENEPVEHSAS